MQLLTKSLIHNTLQLTLTGSYNDYLLTNEQKTERCSVSLSVHMSVCSYVCLSVSLSVHMSVCQSVSQSATLREDRKCAKYEKERIHGSFNSLVFNPLVL